MSYKRGFTLVEMLVAVLLLMTALAGPLTIASRGLTTSVVAKNQITAYYLAQDAIEYIRFIKESNQLCLINNPGGCAASNWLSGLDSTSNGHTNNSDQQGGGVCVSTTGSLACYIDSINDTTAGCGSGVCNNPLRYHSTGGYFTMQTSGAGATPQFFKRAIRIISPVNGNPDEAEVRVLVTWCDAGTFTQGTCGNSETVAIGQTPVGQHAVIVRESIFNWQ
jgi:prepilin-type N-terminal cleavage/methylation domain-containing protein